MILLTGATGLVGSVLLRRLLAAGKDVRCLVRDPRRLGPNRVRVQITLGDLADPVSVRQAVRGSDTVVHLAASIRDQPRASIEELNAMASIRLLRDAQRAGVQRFVFFSAIGATESSRTRFFRAKALAERAVLAADVETYVFAPSIVYSPGDTFLSLLSRFTYLPWIPISGTGQSRFQPIWAEDVAACAATVALADKPEQQRRFELAGPEVLTYDDIVHLALEASGRNRPLIHFPVGLVRRGLGALERIVGPSVFATWEEAELMEEEMISAQDGADARTLGVDPKSMREVLGLAG